MTEAKQSIKAKFIRLQNLLSSQTKTEITIFYLKQLLTFFKEIDMSNQNMMKNEVYEELRDTVKAIFAYLEKVKNPGNDIGNMIQNLIKELLLAISNFCSLFYCVYYPIGCGEMIKEFLASQCRLFVPDFGAAAPTVSTLPAEVKQQIVKEESNQKWIWAKESGFKTRFFSDCVEIIMKNLTGFQANFAEMQLPVIGQYLKLLYYMDDYLIQEKIMNLCLGHVDQLQKIFKNPSKNIMKDANKQKLEDIVDFLTKLLRYCKNEGTKKRIQLLGAQLGISMIKMNSIQKKIVGSKIVSKFSYEMLYRSSSYITETSFSQWLVSQNFFQLVFQDHCQASLIKASEDTFKLLVKRGKLKKQQFQRFFQILQKAEPELRKAMFRLIDPFRVDYYQIQAMLEIFKVIRGVQFYDDQFFYFLEGLSRYSTQIQLTNALGIVQKIINEHYAKFQSYLTRRRSVQSYSYIFQRLITYKDPLERIEAYIKVTNDFVNQPSQNKLILLKTLFQNLTEHKMDRNMQETLCDKIIIDLKFIEKALKLINDIKYKDDLTTTIKIMLKKYSIRYSKQPFSQTSLLESVNYPQIFEEMLKLTSNTEREQLQSLFNELANLSAVQDFQFSCIKSVFIKLNSKNLRPIKKQYTEMIGTYVTYFNPEQFIGLDVLKYLIFNSLKVKIRKGACQLLVQVFTNLSDDFREQGQLYLIDFMKNIILLLQHKMKEFLQGKQTLISVKGALQLFEDLLLNTEYFGVGQLKAHNSLIPTSTVTLKVFNNSTYGDDVLKIFEKKFPSNKTLYDVIVEVSKQFKISPLDMCLEFPNSSAIKYNGLTLEQLKLNNQELNAIRLPQSRLKKQVMLIDGELAPKARKVFTEMFNKYAPNGRMTTKQCSQYIEGVTLSYCPIFDSRINSLYAQYDTDKDGALVLDDFLKFYKDSILDPQKLEVAEKNLGNLRYRRDLKLFDEQIDSLNQQVLFRFHVWQNKEIYQYLFKFTHHQDLQLASLAQMLLLRLPTYPKITQSLTEALNLKQKKPFEVEYLLTALQSQIATDESTSKQLIKSNNHLSIFQYLSQLNSKEIKSVNEKNCLIICLHLLHSLSGLKSNGQILLKKFPPLNFELPKTPVFLNIIRECIKNCDSTLLQPAFILQLTQTEMPFDWIQESVFNKDKDTRIITAGFLYLWTLKYQNKDINLFKIKINPNYNEEWFYFLTLILTLDIEIDFHEIFQTKIKEIQNYSQSLESNRFNPIIHGNLKIIKQLYQKLDQEQKNLLHNTLTHLLPSLISNQNRQLVYQLILIDNSVQLLNILQKIVQVKIGKEAKPRNKFVGIRNLGCICYMNSILQQFFMIEQFHSFIMSLEPKREENQLNGVQFVDDFLYQLQQMYIHLEWSQKQYYDPTKFCLTIKDGQGKPINFNIQQDAHQFLNTAFDKLQRYSKEQEKQKILERIFGGKTVTEIICLTCKNKIQVLEHYYHITVEVKGMKNLKESFDKLIQPEEISDYFCVNCNKRVQKITKQTLFKQTPEILIINLQRIVFDLETFLKVKVHTKLQFEQVLDLHSYFSSSSKPAPYYLKGVVIHSGTSEGGHYYSLIKHEGKWYKFNDQSVTLFNENDLGRQAFGGEEHTDTLGDFTSSTNAYILLYEKAPSGEEQSEEVKFIIDEAQKKLVIQQNREFQHQLQLYQPSYFSCLDTLFAKFIGENGQQEKLNILYEIYLKIIQHLSVNSDIKTQTINQIKDNFLKLCLLIPQKSIGIQGVFDKKTFGETICVHNDVNIREIYAKILVKSLIASIQKAGSQLLEQSKEVTIYMLGLLQDDLLTKNIYKSYQYFQIWKQLISNDTFKKIMIENGFLAKLLDIIMGSDSIHSTKDKKRVDFSVSEAIPIVPVIISLMQTKVNFVGERSNKVSDKEYTEITEAEKKILMDANFYRKMMKTKLDMGLLNPIISLLSYKDEKYSKFIIEVLLRAMNNNDQIEDKNLVFINLKSYFLVDDQFSLERLKWGFGVYQLDSISFVDHQFGMMTSSQSKVFSFVSSLFFVKDQKYMPLLSTLFQKRKYYNAFSAHGILMLLQLINSSQIVLEYILSLPGPTYIHKTYIDWIQTYAFRIKSEEHYGLPYEKNVLWDKLNKLIEQYKEKAKKSPLFNDLPVNKKIIGKNAKVILLDSLIESKYSIDLWAHQTYVLINRPYGMGNFQLPDDQFTFANTAQPLKSKYFLKSLEVPKNDENLPVEKQFSVLTFGIKNKIGLILTFKVPGFGHKIYLKKGESVIYCAFSIGNILDLVEIAEDQQQSHVQPQIKVQERGGAGAGVDNYSIQDYGAKMHLDYGDFGSLMNGIPISCKACTYVNIGVDRCEVCGTDLN